jgi:hypothetical protein
VASRGLLDDISLGKFNALARSRAMLDMAPRRACTSETMASRHPRRDRLADAKQLFSAVFCVVCALLSKSIDRSDVREEQISPHASGADAGASQSSAGLQLDLTMVPLSNTHELEIPTRAQTAATRRKLAVD